MSDTKLRIANGRYIARLCVDPNCGGELVADTEQAWPGGPQRPILRCDGLTYEHDHGALIACPIAHRAHLKGPDHA